MNFEATRYFRDFRVPPDGKLAGAAALVHALGLKVPVRKLSVTSSGSVAGSRRQHDTWTLYDQRYTPEPTLEGHLSFMMRNETVDLLLLKKLFEAIGPAPVSRMVQNEPNGKTSRRLWFFYEFLTGHVIDLEDSTSRTYVDALEPDDYVVGPTTISTRHRVRNNLLGTPDFCPVIRRSEAMVQLLNANWSERARAIVGKVHPRIIARAASFLLLADSQASYQIEGERPARGRLERWMKAVGMAGRNALSVEELERLQLIVLDGELMVHRGLRIEGGFIGDRDMDSNPQPEFISAKHGDLPGLLSGLLDCYARMREGNVDAVLQATCIAFGFVFMHPFEDGNGRIHRYLMHHVLAENEYTPAGVTFPISSVLLDEQELYGRKLRNFSRPLLDFIEWSVTPKLNVQVTNETADLYRYGDYTELCEFLYDCVIRTITEDLPKEIEFLKAYDQAKLAVNSVVEIPDNTVTLLINMIRKNDGRLSKKRRKNEFKALSDEQVLAVELSIEEAFETFDEEYPSENNSHGPKL